MIREHSLFSSRVWVGEQAREVPAGTFQRGYVETNKSGSEGLSVTLKYLNLREETYDLSQVPVYIEEERLRPPRNESPIFDIDLKDPKKWSTWNINSNIIKGYVGGKHAPLYPKPSKEVPEAPSPQKIDASQIARTFGLLDVMDDTKFTIQLTDELKSAGILGFHVENVGRRAVYSINSLRALVFNPRNRTVTFCMISENGERSSATYMRSKVRFTTITTEKDTTISSIEKFLKQS